MANEPIEPAAPAAAPAPVAPAASDPAPVPTPAAEPAPITTFLDGTPEPTAPVDPQPAEPAAPAAPEPVKPAEPAPQEPAKAPEPEKPATEEKPSEAKKDEGDKSAEPAPLPVYEPWKLPEEIQLDDQLSGEFNKLLGEFQNLTKAEHAVVQEFGQNLVDRHITALNETIGRVHEAYTTAWQKQTDGWRELFINDPEIGGKRQETTLKQANEFIDTHGGTAEQKAAFRQVMKQTGLGVHPEVIRLLANAMHNFREGRPLPAPQPRMTVSRTQRMYGQKTG